jgi:hypothetical protein
MSATAIRRSATLVAAGLAVLVAALAIQLSHASQAEAGTVGFCENVNLGGYQFCSTGYVVNTYQDYGWGDNHSVCVSLGGRTWTTACSGGPGQGVYSGALTEAPFLAEPFITNNAAGANRVHAVYFN